MPHTCHAINCKIPVPPKMFMCRTHWYMVPKKLRDAVWAAYNPGQEEGRAPVTEEYLRVTDEAQKAVLKREQELAGK